jgi:hypothetical protein
VIEWLAKISTPPDSRIGGYRHFPPIGNTYIGETTGMFGIVAGLWWDRDRVFASQMQWMSEQHGRPEIGLLGPFGTFSGYRTLLHDSGVQPSVPDYRSEWFRETGVVLRSAFATGRETYLHLIAGEQHEHYDYDSGSIMLWGKGRLLADDFGYIGRHAGEWHSMLMSPAIGRDSKMQIERFFSTEALDYAAGRKDAWRREIAFFKDTDPLGPNGFLLRDRHDARSRANWRLWLTGKELALRSHGAMLNGEEDVDLDVFIYQAGNRALDTLETVQPGKGRSGDRVGAVEISQTALVAELDGRREVTALLYPRLKTEPAPRVTWFDRGAGARIDSSAGTDYLYLARPGERGHELGDAEKALDDRRIEIRFDCQVCSIRVRNDRVTLSLGESGRVQYGEHLLESHEPASVLRSTSR